MRELIVAIDHLILRRGVRGRIPPLIDSETLDSEVKRFRGRGAQNLRLALELSLFGAESRMETLTRLVLTAYGLADFFELQVELFDAEGWIGRFDMVSTARKTIVEFDGDHHRTDRAQYERDLRRLDRARAAGYLVIRLLGRDILRRPHAAAARVAAALHAVPVVHPLARALLLPGN